MHDGWRPWTRSWGLYLGLVAIGSAMLFFGHRTYLAIEKDLSSAAVAGRTSIAILAATTLTQDFQRLIDVGRSLATRVRFGKLLAANRWQEAAQIMATVPNEFAAVDQVLIVDARGDLRAAIPPSGAIAGASLALQDWYRAVAVSRKPYVSDVQTAGANVAHKIFFVAVPVLSGTGELNAVLALRISSHRFLNLFAQLHLETSGSIDVIDRHGLVAYDSADPMGSQRNDLSLDPVVQRVLKGESGVAIDDTRTPGDARPQDIYVSTFAPTSFGWGVIAQWPHSTVFAARDAELRRVTVASAMIIAMTIGVVVLLIQLIVERKQTEVERRANMLLESRVQERTAQLEDMNSELESFSYSISHDLRAPLRAIDSYSHLLLEKNIELLGAEGKKYVDNVHRNIVHMARLIDELLELSRVGRVALEYQQIDMNALAQEGLPAILETHPHVKVSVGSLPSISGDATLIRQIWLNVVDNAVKYSSRVAAPQVSITGEAREGEAVFCVADNGIGFDMQHYDRLFKPFSRLHRPGEFAGTGVGLAIVKRIVERHEGSLWAESVANRGTRIFFSLPMRGV